MQPPNFNPKADDAVNYGAIGVTIGHEISHAFDDKGSQFDGDGNLRNWWTKEDRDNFDKRTALLANQYSQYEVLPGRTLNGELTLGENIADLGGAKAAFRAYKISLKGEPSPIIDNYTVEQRFFIGTAQSDRVKFRDEIFQLCREAKANLFKIIVITNQAGIGRGYYSENEFQKVNKFMLNTFKLKNIYINVLYFESYSISLGSF